METKQLNNTDGRTIVITNIRADLQLAQYDEYEYGHHLPVSHKFYEFEDSFKLIDIENQVNKTFPEILTKLADELGFEVSEDSQNWTIPIGLGGADTLIRVYCPQTVMNTHIYQDTPLGALYELMKPLVAFRQVLTNGSIQYLVTLEDSAREVLESIEGIIIEDKI